MPILNLISPDDKSLSLEATGLLTTMLNVPESDYCTAVQLCEFFKSDSFNTIQETLNELVSKGNVIVLDNKIYAVNKNKIPQMRII